MRHGDRPIVQCDVRSSMYRLLLNAASDLLGVDGVTCLSENLILEIRLNRNDSWWWLHFEEA